jgi:hypothetical protein
MPGSSLYLYVLFHLNLAYSSIEEAERKTVIQNCYRPMLRMAEELSLPIGIEASGYTLETAAAIDSGWIEELKSLMSKGLCEFTGSGYSQLIGPLVPSEVNYANLEIGKKVYKKLLGFQPKVALVNEQAYSSSLIQNYLDAGYEALIMEWDNPALHQKNWVAEWFYLPQYACDQHGKEIALIWNNSIAFQRFQRYVHGDLELEEYITLLASHIGKKHRAYPLYGNDAEIFDFRPGRYTTEAMLKEESEWKRIYRLFAALSEDGRFNFVFPGQVLRLIDEDNAGYRLQLETPQLPIPVKKQSKYNITRWAVTGRDDIGINTSCWQIYEALKKNETAARQDDWRELCYLWSSDFRTHITDRRWVEYLKRLNAFKSKLEFNQESKYSLLSDAGRDHPVSGESDVKIARSGHNLTIEADSFLLKLNCRRGLAIDGLWFGNKEGPALAGTLPHGYYGNIKYGADWYSGHLVFELLGQPKITDLGVVEPNIEKVNEESFLVKGLIDCPLGSISKQYLINLTEQEITLSYSLAWDKMPPGSLRLGFITINPDLFERETLFYETLNGGLYPERFYLKGSEVDYGRSVSFLVSASSGLGLTDGRITLGDSKRALQVEVEKNKAALIGLITYSEFDGTYFYRLALSAGEMDETRLADSCNSKLEYRLHLRKA